MSIVFQSVVIIHENRIRLLFSNALASGAFGSPAPSQYTVECIDGRATDPTVNAAFIIVGSPNAVELALSEPIIKTATYRVSASDIPSTDDTSTAEGSTRDYQWGLSVPKVNVEPSIRDGNRILYGVDLIHNGRDYQETSNGDLDRAGGPANVTKALNRGAMTNPGDLRWDTTYGAGVRQFIDSPSDAAGTLKGSVSAQIMRDPRVQSVKITYKIEDEKTYLFADPKLKTGEQVERVSIEVPHDA